MNKKTNDKREVRQTAASEFSKEDLLVDTKKDVLRKENTNILSPSLPKHWHEDDAIHEKHEDISSFSEGKITSKEKDSSKKSGKHLSHSNKNDSTDCMEKKRTNSDELLKENMNNCAELMKDTIEKFEEASSFSERGIALQNKDTNLGFSNHPLNHSEEFDAVTVNPPPINPIATHQDTTSHFDKKQSSSGKLRKNLAEIEKSQMESSNIDLLAERFPKIKQALESVHASEPMFSPREYKEMQEIGDIREINYQI